MLTSILILLITLSILAYFSVKLRLASIIIALTLLAELLFLSLPVFQWLIIAVPIMAILILLNNNSWRIRCISHPMQKKLAGMLPPISTTEREALDAGQTGWEKTFFTGKPDLETLLNSKSSSLTAREQAFLDGPVETLCKMLNAWEINHVKNDLPVEAWQFMRKEGFFGLIIPLEHQGLEFSALAHSAIITKLSSHNVSAAVTVMVPNSLGPAQLLLHYGTEEQQSRLLPRLARGDEIPCFALTAAEAGSDAAAMIDHGVVCRAEFDGNQDVLGIRLNWRKRYITLAPVATLLGLAFKLYDPDHLLGEKVNIGITLALIPTDTAGVRTGKRHAPMGLAFMNGPTEGDNVFIPMAWVIGGQDQLGCGWRMLMECLGDGRGISLPALATGGAQKASYSCGAYARVRRQFHLPIGKFEGVETVLAEIGGHAYMMNAARLFTVHAMDRGETSTVASAIVKYHLTERMRCCINAAMDLHGGKGISQGPGNYLGEMYQALPIGITVEGANILTRSLIIFGQGVLRCHPYLLTEMKSAGVSSERSTIEFDKALFAHAGMITSNIMRALWLGLTNAQLTHIPVSGPEARYYQLVSRLSAALALCADISLLTLGSAFKRREAISARLGDAFSQLYMISATLKYYRDHGNRKDELHLLQWACEDALYRAAQALDGVLANLPIRPLAWLLRRIVFPWGQSFSPPQDWLNHQVASSLMNPAENRRVSNDIYLPTDKNEPLSQLTDAWHAALMSEDAERKLEHALRSHQLDGFSPNHQDLMTLALQRGVIDQEEFNLLCRTEETRAKVIAVDVFDGDQ